MSGAVLVAVQPVVIEVADDERRETYVDIMTRNELDERVVTTIEILSITNKTPGEHGRQLYLRKQREVIDGQINRVEIDLLRAGMHSTAVARRRLFKEVGPFDYHVCIARGNDSMHRYVYPFRMQDPLPTIEVPLLPDDPPVTLSLQAVLDESYDDGPFRRRVPYELHRVVPSLSSEQAVWAAERLKQR